MSPTSSLPSLFSIAGAILLSLGGGAAIVAGLFRYLGEITARRIIQKEQNIVLREIEELRKEIGLTSSSYDKHLGHVVDYYQIFYRHYLLCQRTAHADIVRHPDREDLNTKKDFLNKIDAFAEDWNSRQGLLRLVLPSSSMEIHEQIVTALNDFKDKVDDFDNRSQESRDALLHSFKEIDRLKQQLEANLRTHLRTDKV